MKVAVLHDQVPEGASEALLDNLVQADEVRRSLEDLGHQAEPVAFSGVVSDDVAALTRLAPDLVFNLVESPQGRGRLIHLAPAVLDRLGLPYTGARTSGMVWTSNKLLAKKALRRAGISTPPWIPRKGVGPACHPVGAVIVKSVWEHASIGLDEDSILPGEDLARLKSEMERRRERLGGDCFAELFVEGREFNISVLSGGGGPEVLPPAEILFDGYDRDKHRVVGYRAKWDADSYEYHHTPRRFEFGPEDAGLVNELKHLTLRCWDLFDLRGWARVDYRVDPTGRPWVLEINANPCLASDAGFMAAAARAELSARDVIRRILADVPAPVSKRSACRTT